MVTGRMGGRRDYTPDTYGLTDKNDSVPQGSSAQIDQKDDCQGL